MVDLDGGFPKQFIKRIMQIDGGINNKEDALKIKDNQFADLQDWEYTSVGDLKMRSGSAAITNNSGTDSIKYMGKWIKSSSESVDIVAYAGKIAKKSGLSLIDILTGLTEASQVKTESFASRLIVCSDGDAVRAIDSGETVRTAGCTAPVAAPTTALGAAGTLDGTYKWGYTWLYPWGESSVSPMSDPALTPSSESVDITIAAYPTGATGAQIYRTTDGGGSLLALATLTSPTLTYNDDLSDGALGVAAPDDNSAPPISKWCIKYKNYMYYIPTTGNRFYYSKLLYPEIVETDSYEIPIDDHDNRLVAIHYTMNPNRLIIFYEQALLSYSGTSPEVGATDPLVKHEINFNLGCQAPFTIDQANGDLIFFGSDRRIHLISRVSLASSETVEPIAISEPIEGTLREELNYDMVSKFQGKYMNRKYILSVATEGYEYLNKTLVVDFDLPEKPWVEQNFAPAYSMGIILDDSNVKRFVFGGYGSTNIFQMFTGTVDAGAQITPELLSKKFTIGYPVNRKTFLEFYIIGEATPEFSFVLTSYITKDASLKTPKTWTVQGAALSTEAETETVWGQGVFGEGTFTSNVSWSTEVQEFKEKIRIEDDGEVFQFKIDQLVSTYRLIIKGFEFRGFIHRSR
jgi:hypothetical protein